MKFFSALAVCFAYSFVVGIAAGDASNRGVIVALLIACAPLAVYAAVRVPIIFPFALYAFLLPFDNLVRIASFGTLTKGIGVLCAGALLFYLVRTRKGLAPPRAALLWIAFLCWAAMSMAWAIDANDAISTLVSFASLILLYVVVSSVPVTPEELGVVLHAAIAGAVAAAGYGIWLFRSGEQVYASRLFLSSHDAIVDPNHFAAVLLLPLAVSIYAGLHGHPRLYRYTMLAASAILISGIYVSGSRGGALGAAVLFAAMVLRSRHRAVLASFFGGAVAVGLLSHLSLWDRFGASLTTGGAGRISIWRAAALYFREHWLLGAGLGNFQNAYDSVYLRVFQRYVADWHRPAHNILASSSVELGVVGLVLLCAGWYAQFMVLQRFKSGHPAHELAVAMQGGLLALFVAAMFLDVMTYKYVWFAFMVVSMTRNAMREVEVPAVQMRALRRAA